MITVTVYGSSGEMRGFTAKGHAEFSESGQDIICAAASVLMINTVNAIDTLTDNHVVAEEKDGFLTCVFPEGVDEEGMLLIETMLLGLTQIQDDYDGKYLQVVMKEE